MSVDGKAVAITGAGSGMGRETARLFARRGADVVAVDVDGAAVEDTVAEIAGADVAGHAIAVRADVTDEDAVAGFIDRTVAEFGAIDVLYNNAGVAQEVTPIEAVDESALDRLLAVNLKGPFFGIKHAVEPMRDQGGGVILNTASIAGLRPRDGLSAYVASKGGVIALTKQAAAELASDDIRVNALCPVAADTPMLADFAGVADRTAIAESLEAAAESVPLGRLAEPLDVAQAAAFLASEEASMITGTALKVDGGRAVSA